MMEKCTHSHLQETKPQEEVSLQQPKLMLVKVSGSSHWKGICSFCLLGEGIN